MRILAVDAGTGTQDILLFDSSLPPESCLKLIMPSATQIAAGRIRQATGEGRAIVLTGVTMGGGPCHRALDEHLNAGLKAYATPDAARTFDDDLDVVQGMGVIIVSEDEARRFGDARPIEMADLNLDAIRRALAAFEVDSDFDGLALACLDHGAAPPGYSDRLFRFEHLRQVVEGRNDLRAFAYLPGELPAYLTRARAMLGCVDTDVPLVLLDTGPAAALGALQDPTVAQQDEQLVINLGNMHALGFHLRGAHIYSLFEHHTNLLSAQEIESLSEGLVAGTLRHEDVFDRHGHGVYYVPDAAHSDGRPFLAVTGPQWGKLKGSR
ncbi:MAG: DUF1786 family protein, partial [Dehalococcoidia bacterium]|nr:DUF1786 family protein [Dehalococcoidia bacterium]